jgi:hypothetical protein
VIKGYCFTNLDSYSREEWPEYFVAVPREGEWIKAKSGRILTVAKVTHEYSVSVPGGEPRPRIRVELHR